MQLLRVVSRDRHSAALVWTVESEGSNDREAAGLQCLEQLGDLALALFSRCKEMEHRAVVPYVGLSRLKRGGQHVSAFPSDVLGQWSEAPSRLLSAVAEMSSTVTSRHPSPSKSSTSVDSQPPTSMMAACFRGATRST